MSEVMEPITLKMRALANETKDEALAMALLMRADDLDGAVKNLMEDGPDGVKKVLGAWARARMLWCKTTGEPLI